VLVGKVKFNKPLFKVTVEQNHIDNKTETDKIAKDQVCGGYI
jgi:hypothetical protein